MTKFLSRTSVLVILIVLVVVGVGYASVQLWRDNIIDSSQQTEQQEFSEVNTADWKTYRWTLALQEVEVVTEMHSRPSTPGPSSGSALGSSGEITAPGQSSPVGLSLYPDHPLRSVPTAPITVSDLITHRSALDGQMVKVRGVVVHTLLGEAACPPRGAGISPGACAQPSIYLADEGKEEWEAHEALRILVQESDTGYDIGQVVVIRGRVIGNRTAVHMVQE